MDQQITKEQAIALYESDAWKEWTDEQIVDFQLYQSLLAVPFERFHEAVSKVLGRPVFTHEFADPDSLRAEHKKEREPKTFTEILSMLPADRTIVVEV